MVGQHEEHPERSDNGEGHRKVGTCTGPVCQDPQRQQRLGDPGLPDQESGHQRDADRRRGEHRPGGPALGGGAGAAEHDRDQAGRDQGTGDGVEARLGVAAVAGEHGAAGDGRAHGDGDVDEQAPAPAGVLGEDAAEQQSDRCAARGDGAVHAERPGPLARFGEGGRDQRQRGRGQDRGEAALECATHDQGAEVRREAREGGRRREPGEADQERSPAAEPVGDPATEQQQPRQRAGVGGDDPGPVRVAEAEVLLRGGQRDVHDRGVQRDHQLGDGDHDQRRPAGVAAGGPAGPPVGSGLRGSGGHVGSLQTEEISPVDDRHECDLDARDPEEIAPVC